MKIENDKATFEAADVAALSPATQASLAAFFHAPTAAEALTKVVNNQISLANRMQAAKIVHALHAAPPEVRAQAQAHFDKASEVLKKEPAPAPAPVRKGLLSRVVGAIKGS